MSETSFTIKCNNCGTERELKEGQHRVVGSIVFTMLSFLKAEDTVGMSCSRCDSNIVLGKRFGK